MHETATTIPREVVREADRFTHAQLDALPFGAIQLDRDGVILRFNEYEANLSSRRAPETIGKNFFIDVAPCTNVREFHGRFVEGIETGRLQVTFPYRFAFKPVAREVDVTLFYSDGTETVWVFVQDREIPNE